MDLEKIGVELKSLRKKKKVGIIKAGKEMNISTEIIQNIEKGKSVNTKSLAKYLTYLNATIKIESNDVDYQHFNCPHCGHEINIEIK
jgi:transcriptional regulator with XRE-family HTH domain